MKYKILLFIILFPVFALAQTKAGMDSLIKNTLTELKNSWTLGVDSNSNTVDIRLFNKFKELFDTSATVADDFNVFYLFDPKTNSGTYVVDTTQKTFDTYAHDIALQVSKLRIDTLGTALIKIIDAQNITVEIKRVVYIEKARFFILPDTGSFAAKIISSRSKKIRFQNAGDAIEMAANLKDKIADNPGALYQFADTSTLLIKMAFNEKENIVKIKSIRVLSNKIKSLNDADEDAILDRSPKEDNLKNNFGDFTASGMPDYDLDGVPNNIDKCPETYGTKTNHGCPVSYFSTRKQVDGFVGLQLNSAKINLPELNNLGYRDESGNDAVRVLESKKGLLKNPRLLPGLYGGGDITYYFGRRKKIGLSVGFTYTSFKANYELTEPINYTFKSSDGVDFYRRQIIISNLSEEIDYSVINLPVMYNYRGRLFKLLVNFKAGPSLMLFNNRSDYNAIVDIGGIYQVDPNENKIVYDPFFDPVSIYNVYVTTQGINNQSTDPGAANVFSQLSGKNYDFISNGNYRGKKKLYRTTVGFNVDLEGQNNINGQLAIKVGVHVVYAPLFTKTEKYKPIDKSTDEFRSIYNSSAKSSYSAFGMNVGIICNF